jgi:AhpD family alkylhydroperoxidase
MFPFTPFIAMPSTYQSPEDLAFAAALARLAPPEAQAFLQLKSTAERHDGHIPDKYRELISLAVALTTQCAYCIDVHTKNAVAAGVSQLELAEAVFITAALRAGAAVGHGLMALRLHSQASAATIAASDQPASRPAR